MVIQEAFWTIITIKNDHYLIPRYSNVKSLPRIASDTQTMIQARNNYDKRFPYLWWIERGN